MRAKHLPLTAQRAQLIKQILEQDKRRIIKSSDKKKAVIRRQYSRTFAHWNESGINKFPVPTVTVEVTYKRIGDKGHIAIIKAYVKNQLWNWLDAGTPTIIQPTTSPPIRERADIRTFPGDLDAKPFPGFTGNYFVIRAGMRRRGIPARKWTETIADIVGRSHQTDDGIIVIKVVANGRRVL